jgi:hypothetical protein
MKIILSLAVMTALVALEQGTTCRAADEDGVALAIIYDTSGSMNEPVRDSTGRLSPKYIVANRALAAVAKQIQAFATSTAAGAPRKVQAGLFVFSGNTARQAVKFGPFDAAALEHFAASFSEPSGYTPLGNALTLAGQAVLFEHRVELAGVFFLPESLAAELFDVIHSLDSVKLALKLSESGLARGKPISVLLEVKLGEEETKSGALRNEVHNIVSAVRNLNGIRLDGLMTMPPYFEDPEQTRPFFEELRRLRDSLEREEPGCLGQGHLSMGMSHDFQVAIQEGATIVRIGTAIFGVRHHE